MALNPISMNRACPICKEHINQGKPISWSMVFNGEHTMFSIDVCQVDYTLCEVYPTIKTAAMKSEAVMEMLRRAYRYE